MTRLITFITFFVLLTSTFLFANPNYYVNLGMSKPYAPDDFQKNWRSGFNLGAGLGYNLSPKFEVQAELFYDNFQLDDNAFLGDITKSNDPFASVLGGSTSIFTFFANAKILSPLKNNSSFTPYLIGGVGIASKSIGEMDITTEDMQFVIAKDSETTVSAGAGLGVEIVMGARTSFVIEGRFNALFTDETTVYLPVKLGIVIR